MQSGHEQVCEHMGGGARGTQAIRKEVRALCPDVSFKWVGW